MWAQMFHSPRVWRLPSASGVERWHTLYKIMTGKAMRAELGWSEDGACVNTMKGHRAVGTRRERTGYEP
jgi:hypothetical protein